MVSSVHAAKALALNLDDASVEGWRTEERWTVR